ncbi:MAG TPA: protein kinase [Polyangia bacterium]|nr:protein kinase [Polyangia bacterium]
MSPEDPSNPPSPGEEAPPGATLRVDHPGEGKHPILAPGEGAPDPDALPFIDQGRYIVEGEHARGGLGRILKAHDPRLERTVAIKELLQIDKDAAARFVREARVTARLQHPSIVPIHEAGRWPTGELFYAMKLISGRSLDRVIDETHSLEERLALLPHITAVADAIAYAHSQRVIHRDLKPANVLIGPFGETVVIDWGLAKDLTRPEPAGETAAVEELGLAARPDLTMAGMILGTPEYMAPEQAESAAVDERADVYALGAMLYHTLSGGPPYSGSNTGEVLAQVRHRLPLPLAEREPSVPRDLLTIVDKAMARRPEERYPSARELAEDLRRFQTGQVVSARHYSRITLIGRWLSRHRVPVALTTVFLFLLGALGGLSVRRVVREREVAQARSNELILLQARSALERDPTAALAWLKQHPLPPSDVAAVRDVALDAWGRGVALHVFEGTGKESWGDFSPEGKRLAVANPESAVRVLDLTHGATLARRVLHRALLLTRFSRDGQTLGVVERDSDQVQLWELATGHVHTLVNPGGTILHTLFSPDGRWLLAGGSGHRILLWDLVSKESLTLEGYEGNGSGIAVSPDGRYAAYGGTGGTIRLVELKTRQARSLPAGVVIGDLDFSPDGRYLVAAGREGHLSLWDLTSETSRMLRGHKGHVVGATFSPDGRHVVSGGQDHTVRLWDVATGEGRLLGEHESEVRYVIFSPDGQRVLSVGRDQVVRFWGPGTGEERFLRGHDTIVSHAQFTPDGRMVLSMGLDENRVWPLPQRPLRVLRTDGLVRDVAYSPDGGQVAVASWDGLLWLWNTRTGAARSLRGHQESVTAVAFSPDGRRVASASLDLTVRLWDVARGTSRVLRGHEDKILEVIFSPDGRQLASAGIDGLVYLWDASTGEGRALRGRPGEIRSIAFSPDGRQLVSADPDGRVRLWEVTTGQSRVLVGHTALIRRVVLSRDGRTLATASEDGTTRLWDVATGENRWTLRHTAPFWSVALSPDGQRLAAAEDGGRLRLCEIGTRSCRSLTGHHKRVEALDFSPDGRQVASGSHDGTVRLWDTATGACSAIHHHEDAVLSIAFSPDGRELASSGFDRTARLWPVEPELAPPLDPQGLRAWMETVTSAVIPPGHDRPSSP